MVSTYIHTIRDRHLFVFSKFSVWQLYAYIRKANNKLKGPHHTVLQANINFIQRTLERIFDCFIICPPQSTTYMYVSHFMGQSCLLHSGKRNTAWFPSSWELPFLSGWSTYDQLSDRVSTWSALLQKQVVHSPFDESSRAPISTFNRTQAVGMVNYFKARK